METEKKKKKKGLLIALIIAGVVALAGIGVGAYFLFGNKGNGPAPSSDESEEPSTEDVVIDGDLQIFWNVDRLEYDGKSEIGLSSRVPDPDDGYYHITFATNGRQVMRRCADKALVNLIDKERAMALVFDEKGIITDFIPVSKFTGGYAYDGMYVVEGRAGKTVVFNSSAQLNGMDFEVQCAENCKVYDVSGTYFDPGMEISFTDMTERDRAVCIKNKDDEVFLIFLTDRYTTDFVYWNVNIKYNSSLSSTTREPNEDGLYEFLIAYDGKLETMYTRDRDVASAIDKVATHAVGLRRDENGLITECYAATKAAGGGGYFGSWAWITDVSGTTVKAERPATGSVDVAELAPEARIFDCAGIFCEVGTEITLEELGLWDQIVGFKDANGKINNIFIAYRHVDGPMYFLVSKQGNTTTKETTRVPDANGYYVYELAVDGTMKKFRTNDKSLADRLDTGASFFGLKTEGDVILDVYPARSVSGNYTTAGGYTIAEVLGDGRYVAKLISGTATNAGDTIELMLSDDAYVCNVSTVGQRGELTTLRVGDRVWPNLDPALKVSHVFITQRTVPGGQIYARTTRNYNSTTKQTTRTPKDDGYYYIGFTHKGELVTLKTADKSIVTKIDSLGYAYMCLTVNGDVITGAYEPQYCPETPGGISPSYCDVLSKSGSSVRVQRNIEGSDYGKQYVSTLGSNVEIYNIAGEYNIYGEPTTIRVGDRISVLLDSNSKARYVYIVQRASATKTAECPVCGESVTWTSFNGSFAASKDGKPVHYYLAGNRTTQSQTNTPADTEIHFDVNGKTWAVADEQRLLALFNENSYVMVFDTSKTPGTLKAGTGRPSATTGIEVGPVIWLRYATDVLTISDVTLDFSNVKQSTSQGALLNAANSLVVLDNVTIKGGDLLNGAAIYANGGIWLNDCTITGGMNESGGSVYVSSTGEILITGKTTIKGGKRQDGTSASLVLAPGRKIETVAELGGITSTAEAIAVRLEQNGTFTDAGFDSYIGAFTSDIEGAEISANEDGSLAISYSLTGIEFAEESFTVKVGAPTDLTVNQLPIAIAGTVVTYASYDETKVVITEDGKAVGLQVTGPEGVTVTATAGEFTATCKVIVEEGEIGEHYHAETTNAHIATDSAKITWTKWENAEALPTESGFYYLDTDVTLPEGTSQAILSNVSLHLCLNGHKVQGNMRAYLLYAKGAELTICDCSEGETGIVQPAAAEDANSGRTIYVRQGAKFTLYGGTIAGGITTSTAQPGGNVFVDNGSVFNMYGGTIKDGQQNGGKYGGGNVGVAKGGTFNFYDGLITGAQSSGNGANIYSAGTFNMYGGTISNGVSTNTGGNVMIGDGAFTMTGGLITGGTTKVWAGSENLYTYANNGEVHLLGGKIDGNALFLGVGLLELGGDVIVANDTNTLGLFLRDHASITSQNVVISDGRFKEGAKIYVSATRTADGLIAKNAKSGDEDAFICDDAHTVELVEDDSSTTGYSLYLKEKTVPEHAHCICGGTLAETEGHTCEEIEFTAWSNSTALPTTTGNYFLAVDVTVSGVATIKSGQNVVLCLNGHTVTATGTRAYYLEKNSTDNSLTITDCTDAGKIVSTKTNNGNNGGGLVLAYGGDNSVLNIYAGTFSLSEEYTATTQGGMIYQLGKSVFNMYGGTLQGAGSIGGNGGVVSVTAGTTFNMYGGTIRDGKTTANGGNVNVAGTFNMYGGTITGGSANVGGNVNVLGSGVFNMEDGEITGGTSTGNGGGVASAGTTTIAGGSFSGNTATTGANFLVNGGKFTVTGGTFKAGTFSSLDSGNGFIHGAAATVELLGGNFDGGITVYAVNDLKLGGSVVIANEGKTSGLYYGSNASAITVQNISIADTGLTEGANIYVAMTRDGMNGFIASNAKESDLPYFTTSADYDLELLADSASTTGFSIYRTKKENHEHCICGGKLEGTEGHTCGTIRFDAWTSENSLPTTTGNYYLTEDVTLASAQTIASDQNVVLCLNGHNVNVNGVRAYFMAKDSTNNSLTITDCVGTGTIRQNKKDNGNNGGGIILAYGGENSVVNLYGGKFTANAEYTTTASAGMVYLLGKSVVNIYNGTFEGGKTTANGGFAAVGSANATLNVFGGTIKNCSANVGGAISTIGTLNLYGGTLEGNTAAEAGGSIAVLGSGTLTVDGAVIKGGTAPVGGNIVNYNTMTLASGTIQGGKNTESGNSDVATSKPFTVGEAFAAESPVGVTFITSEGAAAEGVFTTGAADETLFTSDDSGYTLEKLEDGTLFLRSNALRGIEVSDAEVDLSYDSPEKEVTVTLTPAEATYTTVTWVSSDEEVVTVKQDETDPLRAVLIFVKPDETATVTVTVDEFSKEIAVTTAGAHKSAAHEEDDKWTEWTSTDTLPTYADLQEGDNYFYLANDVTLTATWVPAQNGSAVEADMNGRKITICLNGHDIIGPKSRLLTTLVTATPRVYTENLDITFTDCSETPGSVKCSEDFNYGSNIGMMFWMGGAGDRLTIINVTLDANGGYSSGSGGLIYLNNGAELNLFSGAIQGGKTTHASTGGGNVYADGGSVINVYDGEIRNGTASGAHGGNVYLANGSVMNVYGGKITGGSANFRGGNILVNKSTLNTFEDAEISEGKSTGNSAGGNIATLNASTITIKGSVVRDGSASGSTGASGGNIAMMNGSTLTISDGATISGGTSTGRAGNIYIDNASNATITDSIVSGGKSYQFGGSIYVDAEITADKTAKGSLTIENSTVEGGTADTENAANTFGGNVYSKGDFILKNSVVKDGKAAGTTEAGKQGFGGNLYFFAGTATISDSTVTGGESSYLGGNLYLTRCGDIENTNANARVTVSNTTITEGKADNGSAAYVAYATTLILSGKTVITDNTVMNEDAAKNAAVFVANSAATVLLKDETVISGNKNALGTETNLFLVTNAKISTSGIKDTASIGIFLQATEGIFTDYSDDFTSFFRSDRAGYKVVFEESALAVRPE